MSKAEADGRCKAGKNVPTAGSTPPSIKGATRIDRDELVCLATVYFPRLHLVTPIKDELVLPDTERIPIGPGGGSFTDERQRVLEQKLKQLTGGDKSSPLVFYCHSASCGMSYNMVVRALHAGYTNVYWFRNGLAEWPRKGWPRARADNDPNPGTWYRSDHYFSCQFQDMAPPDPKAGAGAEGQVTVYASNWFRGTDYGLHFYEWDFMEFLKRRYHIYRPDNATLKCTGSPETPESRGLLVKLDVKRLRDAWSEKLDTDVDVVVPDWRPVPGSLPYTGAKAR